MIKMGARTSLVNETAELEIVKIERLKNRPDGSEVKIGGQTMYGAGLHLSVDV